MKLFVLVMIGAFLATNAAAGQDARPAFLSEYSPHARAIRHAYTNLAGRYRSTYFSPTGGAGMVYNVEFKIDFYRSYCQCKVTALTDSGKVVNLVPMTNVANSRYSFQLLGSGLHGQSVLRDFKPREGDPQPTFNLLCFPFMSTRFGGRSYLDLATDPKSRIVSYDGEDVKSLLVEFAAVADGATEPTPHRVEYRFDPARRWVCVGAKSFAAAPPHTLEFEEIYLYGPDEDGWPALKGLESFATHAGARRPVAVVEVLEAKRLPVPFEDKDFTMSAFGLPEPEGMADGVRPPMADDALAPPMPAGPRSLPIRFVTVVAASAAAVSLGLYLWRRKRRA